jgi:hypothetical protein
MDKKTAEEETLECLNIMLLAEVLHDTERLISRFDEILEDFV